MCHVFIPKKMSDRDEGSSNDEWIEDLFSVWVCDLSSSSAADQHLHPVWPRDNEGTLLRLLANMQAYNKLHRTNICPHVSLSHPQNQIECSEIQHCQSRLLEAVSTGKKVPSKVFKTKIVKSTVQQYPKADLFSLCESTGNSHGWRLYVFGLSAYPSSLLWMRYLSNPLS